MVEEDVRFSLPPELAAAFATLRITAFTNIDDAHTLTHVNSDTPHSAQAEDSLAAEHLLSLQHPDGYWCALLTADTTLESDYILLQLWLHRAGCGTASGIRPNAAKSTRAAERILSSSCPTAASTFTSKGPSEISASVKAYFALKLAGIAG